MKLPIALFTSTLLMSTASLAAPPQAIVDSIKKYASGETIDSVVESPIKGVYEVVIGAQMFYLSADGRHLMTGSIIHLPTRTNLSEQSRNKVRKNTLAKVSEKQMIVYKPAEETKHTLTVFTDIDCGYCRILHEKMAGYLDRGIEVRYLLFPRGGERAASYDKSVSVWCSDDRKGALTEAKAGKDPELKRCDNPVGDHMALGKALGVSATPTLVLADGSVLPGYIPPERLGPMLESNAKR